VQGFQRVEEREERVRLAFALGSSFEGAVVAERALASYEEAASFDHFGQKAQDGAHVYERTGREGMDCRATFLVVGSKKPEVARMGQDEVRPNSCLVRYEVLQ
jgi:hypothetical protein